MADLATGGTVHGDKPHPWAESDPSLCDYLIPRKTNTEHNLAVLAEVQRRLAEAEDE